MATHTPPQATRARKRATIVVHGLGGHQDLFHIIRLAQVLSERGHHLVRMNMRGRGPGENGSPNALLGGHCDDLALVTLETRARLGVEDIDLLGYSFGGNMVLRYVGAQSLADYPEVSRCFAVSAPVDLQADVKKLKRVFPAFLQKRITKSLTRMVKQADPRAKQLGEMHDFVGFEGAYIAEILGQGKADSFYQSMSAAPFLQHIATPTHIIWSQDDPVVDVDAYRNYQFSKFVRGYRTRYGGHVGFCRPFAAPPKRWWLDELLLDLVNS